MTQERLRVLSGCFEVTLETIAKLEEALDQSQRTYLSEPEQAPYGENK